MGGGRTSHFNRKSEGISYREGDSGGVNACRDGCSAGKEDLSFFFDLVGGWVGGWVGG